MEASTGSFQWTIGPIVFRLLAVAVMEAFVFLRLSERLDLVT